MFPEIKNINDVLPYIEEEESFKIIKKDGYTVIDYVIEAPNTFPPLSEGIGAAIRRECRGICFDESGKIVRRGLQKFHNLNQTDETQVSNIDWSKPHTVTDKRDGCLPSVGLIELTNGKKISIGTMVREQMGYEVWGVNSDGKVVPSKVLGYSKKSSTSGNWKTLLSKDISGRLRSHSATDNHKFFSEGTYKELSELMVGDRISYKVEVLSDIQRQFYLGSLIGDSSLIPINGSLTLQGCHKKDHEDLVKLKADIFKPYACSVRDSVSGFGSETIQYRVYAAVALTGLSELTYSGKKTLSEDWVNSLDEISLAAWYMDDGSISYGQKGAQRPRACLHTEGYDLDTHEMIQACLKKNFGLEPVIGRNRDYYFLRFNADCAIKLWDMIAQYVIPVMRYKMPDSYRDRPCFWDNYVPTNKKSFEMKEYAIQEVCDGISSKAGSNSGFRYDIQTETGNFFYNDVLVHNSLIFPLYLEDGNFLGTRKGKTDVASMADKFVSDNKHIKYDKLIEDMRGRGYTVFFEFFCADNMIVIDYGEESMVALAARHMSSGDYMKQSELEVICKRYNVPCVEVFDVDLSEPTEFLKKAKAEEGKEGYVIRFEDGYTIKVKGDWYVGLHKIVDSINSRKNLVKLILDKSIDDIIPALPKARVDYINSFQERFFSFERRLHKSLMVSWNGICEDVGLGATRKDWAIRILKEDKYFSSLYFKLLDKLESPCKTQASVEMKDILHEFILSKTNKEIVFEGFVEKVGFEL